MQFVAERRIENGLQFVTPIFLNPPHCLYIKKNCFSFQNYEEFLRIIFLLQKKCKNKEREPYVDILGLGSRPLLLHLLL